MAAPGHARGVADAARQRPLPLSAQADLSPNVGAVNPDTGFPTFYADRNGLAIAPCLNGLPMCLDTAEAFLAEEGFYSTASAEVGNMAIGLVLEGAHDLDTGLPITFMRSQYAGNGPGSFVSEGTYTITDPYGTNTCTAELDGSIPNNACRFETGGPPPATLPPPRPAGSGRS